MKRTARVIVASNRAATGVYADQAGPVITAWLADRSYEVPEPMVVADGEPVAQALRECVADQVDVVITTGGTGISPTDRTPEATAPLLDFQVPGLANALRAAGQDQVPAAALSRGLVGVAERTLVVNLPGSLGGVRDGLAVLDPVLEHAVDQIAGGDHVRATEAQVTTPMSAPTTAPSGSAEHAVRARVVRTQVTEAELSVEEYAQSVRDAGAGAVATFTGVVRNHDGGRSVHSLHYEGHPSADDVLATAVADVAERSAGVRAVAAGHRLGSLDIGDVALVCAAAADHRAEAFAVCAELVDEIKARLPVWKHQRFTDGTEEWVNSP